MEVRPMGVSVPCAVVLGAALVAGGCAGSGSGARSVAAPAASSPPAAAGGGGTAPSGGAGSPAAPAPASAQAGAVVSVDLPNQSGQFIVYSPTLVDLLAGAFVPAPSLDKAADLLFLGMTPDAGLVLLMDPFQNPTVYDRAADAFVPLPGYADAPRGLSLDGRFVVGLHAQATVSLFDRAQGAFAPLPALASAANDTFGPNAVSADGSRIAYLDPAGTARVFDRVAQAEIYSAPASGGFSASPAGGYLYSYSVQISADGGTLLYTTPGAATVAVVDLASGAATSPPGMPAAPLALGIASANGRFLPGIGSNALPGGGSAFEVLDTAAMTPLALPAMGLAGGPDNVTVSGDGRFVAGRFVDPVHGGFQVYDGQTASFVPLPAGVAGSSAYAILLRP
jgi:hypothetical protein